MNQKILDEITGLDYPAVTRRIEEFLLGQVENNRSDGVVFGLSGGIDSAVLAYICKRVLREKTLAMIMPDTDITPMTETEDALKMVALTGIDYKLVDIKPVVNEYSKYIEPNKRAKGNLRARVRTNILYYYANAKNYLVLGSSDKSEHLIGYFTKFGDGAADLAPIISLYKLQVRGLAGFLDVPQGVISKKSSPHLWSKHAAEDEIGATYEEIDSALYCLLDKRMSVDEAAGAAQLDRALVEKISRAHQESEHKRRLPQRPEKGQA